MLRLIRQGRPSAINEEPSWPREYEKLIGNIDKKLDVSQVKNKAFGPIGALSGLLAAAATMLFIWLLFKLPPLQALAWDPEVESGVLSSLATLFAVLITIMAAAFATGLELREHDGELAEAALISYTYQIQAVYQHDEQVVSVLDRAIHALQTLKKLAPDELCEPKFDDKEGRLVSNEWSVRAQRFAQAVHDSFDEPPKILQYPDAESAKGISKLADDGQLVLLMTNELRVKHVNRIRQKLRHIWGRWYSLYMEVDRRKDAIRLDDVPADSSGRALADVIIEEMREVQHDVRASSDGLSKLRSALIAKITTM